MYIEVQKMPQAVIVLRQNDSFSIEPEVQLQQNVSYAISSNKNHQQQQYA